MALFGHFQTFLSGNNVCTRVKSQKLSDGRPRQTDKKINRKEFCSSWKENLCFIKVQQSAGFARRRRFSTQPDRLKAYVSVNCVSKWKNCYLTENEKITQFTIFREPNDLQISLICQINLWNLRKIMFPHYQLLKWPKVGEKCAGTIRKFTRAVSTY